MLIIRYINKDRTVDGFKPHKEVSKDFIIYRTSNGYTIGLDPKTGEQKLIEKSDDFNDTLEDEETLRILIKDEVAKYEIVQIPRFEETAAKDLSPIIREHEKLLTYIANSNVSSITSPYIRSITNIKTREQAKTLIQYLTDNGIFTKYSTYWRLNKEVKKLLRSKISSSEIVNYSVGNGVEEKVLSRPTGYRDSDNPMDIVRAELALMEDREPEPPAKKTKKKSSK